VNFFLEVGVTMEEEALKDLKHFHVVFASVLMY